MTAKNPPVWLEAGSYASDDDRLVTSLLTDRTLATNKTTLAALEGGVVPPLSNLQVTAPNGNMTLTISAGTAIVPRVSLDPPGVYVCHNQGLASLTLDVANSATRIDMIVAKVLDATQGDAGNVWAIQAVKGVESATPTAPNITGSAIPLASVRVIPAAQNGGINRITGGQITDVRVFTTGLGGVHLVWGSHPNPASSPGRLMYDVPNGSLYVGNGTGFDPLYTFTEMKTWLAKYRPDQALHQDECSTASTTFDAVFRDDATPASTDPMPVTVTNLSSPSGLFMVHMSLAGMVSDASTVGSTSFQVKRVSNGNVVSDNVAHRGPLFSRQDWESGQVSSLVGTGLIDTPCSFTVFARVSSGSGRISMRRIKLVVEPVL